MLFDGPHTFVRVALYAFGLGFVAGAGLLWVALGPAWKELGIYFAATAIFHQLEYLQTALWKPKQLSLDSFLLNHSHEYHAAFVAATVEYLVESWLFPGLKALWPIKVLGLIALVGGQVVRVLAMATARESFNHIVQHERREDHKLITHGIDAVMRHPSYFGFSWFALGAQLLLVNPICLVAYVFALRAFFHTRIQVEEAALVRMFPEYNAYRARVPVLMPFIA